MQRPLLLIALLFSIFLPCRMNAQVDEEVKIERKARNWDTLKYQKFETVFIVGLIYQQRTFSNEFNQSANRDTLNLSKHTYSTETDATGAFGFVFNYDKFQVNLTWTPKPPGNNAGKGHTDVFNLGVNVGDNRWVAETYYRRFRGFYDQNTPNFDSAYYNKTKQYDLRPGMVSSLFMARFMHFTNYKKFSYKAGFGCNYRQLKRAATLIVGGSVSSYNLRNDSAILPFKARYLYKDYGDMKGMQSLNISANVGVAATLVLLKAWFITGHYTFGPELQFRNYDLTSRHAMKTYVGGSGTGRLSLGLNLKKFYYILSYTNDRNRYDIGKSLNHLSTAHTITWTGGIRIHSTTPKFYQKFQQSKLYGYL